MKFTKLSLVAALLAGTATFAVDNVKVSGDANLFYSTSDAASGYDDVVGKNGKLFSKDSSAADASINLNVTADLAKNDLVTVSAGAGYTVLTTLGLENNFVSNVWGSSHGATAGNNASYASALNGAKVENANWVTEAWVAVTAGKTTAKLGRMELDTPLAFTEKWSIEKNTFEAAVVINQDIPDTTLVAAWVGNGNGTETFGNDVNGTVRGYGLAAGSVVNQGGQFTTYGQDGAYAVGLINNSFKPLTVQAWYYDVTNTANAYWLQADLACQKVPGLMAGVQYTELNIYTSANINGATPLTAEVKSDALAVMLGYEMKDMATVKVAYSQIGKDHSAGQNTATDFVGGSQSKLYTEAYWGGNFGKITQKDTDSYKISVESPVNGLFDLVASYTNADQATGAGDMDMTEIAVAVSKSYGPADITLAYINSDVNDGDATTDDKSNTVQAYLTVNF